MDFTFSDDQDALRESVRAFLTREAASGYVREMADDERGFTDAMWEKIAELGWPGLLVPESNGGIGLGLVDMAVVMEEMRHRRRADRSAEAPQGSGNKESGA